MLFSLQLLSETFLILRIIRRDIVINMKTTSCKVSVNYRILIKLKLYRQIFENISNIQWESSRCMRTDGRMVMAKLIVAFNIFRKRLKTHV
jgi:hypothetical protein